MWCRRFEHSKLADMTRFLITVNGKAGLEFAGCGVLSSWEDGASSRETASEAERCLGVC